MKRDSYRISGIVLNRSASEPLSVAQPAALRKARHTVAALKEAAPDDKFTAMLHLLDTTLVAHQDVWFRLQKFAEQFEQRTRVLEIPEFAPAIMQLGDLVRIADILGAPDQPRG